MAENVTVVNGATGIGTNGDGKTLNGLYASYSVDKYGVITKVNGYSQYTGTSDAKSAINNEPGVDKRSADYTVILGTDTANGGSNITISVDDNATYYTVDKNGEISTSSYRSVVRDDNDKVFAAVKDYLVQTLIVESVADGQGGYVGDLRVVLDTANNEAIIQKNTIRIPRTTRWPRSCLLSRASWSVRVMSCLTARWLATPTASIPAIPMASLVPLTSRSA